MLDSALDLITEAASNSLFIFCFCNLIIVMILLGSKPSSSFQQKSPTPVVIANAYEYSKLETNSKHSIPTIMDVQEQSTPQEQEAPTYDSEEGRTENCSTEEEEEEEEEDDDDELRRTFEEFIEKVNRGWRAEQLRNSRLVKA